MIALGIRIVLSQMIRPLADVSSLTRVHRVRQDPHRTCACLFSREWSLCGRVWTPCFHRDYISILRDGVDNSVQFDKGVVGLIIDQAVCIPLFRTLCFLGMFAIRFGSFVIQYVSNVSQLVRRS
jgi:hypothetical protein